VGMALIGKKAERVIADTVDCVWSVEIGCGVLIDVVITGVGVPHMADAHMAAATAGRQQDTIAGGLQSSGGEDTGILGAGSISAVPPSTHGKNANQPRPGP